MKLNTKKRAGSSESSVVPILATNDVDVGTQTMHVATDRDEEDDAVVVHHHEPYHFHFHHHLHYHKKFAYESFGASGFKATAHKNSFYRFIKNKRIGLSSSSLKNKLALGLPSSNLLCIKNKDHEKI